MEPVPLILVIDDEANFREILQVLLGAQGFRVAEAENGEEGISQAKALKPNLILLDMKMPGMSGAETLEKMRQEESLKDVKVIFLTNFGDVRKEFTEADRHFSAQVGALDYVKKSDINEILIERVKKYLQP